MSACAAKQVEFNNLQRDLTAKRSEIDACDPNATNNRRLEEELATQRAYVDAKTAEFNAAVRQFETEFTNATRLNSGADGALEYLEDLESRLTDATTRERDLERAARRERRRFVDGDPQSGVGGAPGVRTSDDRVLLTFWICYGAAFIACAVLISRIYGMKYQDALKIFIPAGIAAYAIAYYCIAYYG
jgi:hypothetical protein